MRPEPPILEAAAWVSARKKGKQQPVGEAQGSSSAQQNCLGILGGGLDEEAWLLLFSPFAFLRACLILSGTRQGQVSRWTDWMLTDGFQKLPLCSAQPLCLSIVTVSAASTGRSRRVPSPLTWESPDLKELGHH